MKTMMKVFALALFMCGSVLFMGCGETTTAPAEDPAAETGTTETEGDTSSTEAGADAIAKVSFNVEGIK